jgi:hypothetical protein
MSDLYLLQHMVLSIKTGTVPNDDKTTPPTKQKDPSSMAAYQIQAWPTHLAQSQMVASRMIKPGECVLSETALIVVSGQPGRTEPIFWSREFGAVGSGAANPGYVATIAPEVNRLNATDRTAFDGLTIHPQHSHFTAPQQMVLGSKSMLSTITKGAQAVFRVDAIMLCSTTSVESTTHVVQMPQ